MKYLLTVNVPDNDAVDSAMCIQQINETLKLLPREYNSSVEQIEVLPSTE